MFTCCETEKDANCCTGSHGSPTNCPNEGIRKSLAWTSYPLVRCYVRKWLISVFDLQNTTTGIVRGNFQGHLQSHADRRTPFIQQIPAVPMDMLLVSSLIHPIKCFFAWGCSDCQTLAAYDDRSAVQSTHTCPGVESADYTVTFCPYVQLNNARRCA
jgi:hypothetical protein